MNKTCGYSAGEVRTSLLTMFSYGPLHMDEQGLGNQFEFIYNSSLQTGCSCRKRWMIETNGKRGSGKFILTAQHDDDDNDDDLSLSLSLFHYLFLSLFVSIYQSIYRIVHNLIYFLKKKVNFLLNQRYHDFIITCGILYHLNKYHKGLFISKI